MSEPIALIGSPNDAHVAAVARSLEERGVDLVVVDTYRFPDDYRITLGEDVASIEIEGQSLARPAAGTSPR